jgi:hypothetical protein
MYYLAALDLSGKAMQQLEKIGSMTNLFKNNPFDLLQSQNWRK